MFLSKQVEQLFVFCLNFTYDQFNPCLIMMHICNVVEAAKGAISYKIGWA